MKIFLGGLHWQATHEEIRQWCLHFGVPAFGVQVVRKSPDATLIVAFVTFKTQREGLAALRLLPRVFWGHRITVCEAKEKQKETPAQGQAAAKRQEATEVPQAKKQEATEVLQAKQQKAPAKEQDTAKEASKSSGQPPSPSDSERTLVLGQQDLGCEDVEPTILPPSPSPTSPADPAKLGSKQEFVG